MTMEDANSVYVGGLPYDVTEEALRRVFSTYGTVVDIKIVNDRSVRGKCYGFVTFSNRRSADDAIQDMDGKIIGGRAVRVNEVTTRFGGQGRFQPQSPSDGRSDFGYERDRFSDRSRERDRSQDRRRAYERSHGFEGRNDHGMLDRDGYKERGFEEGDWRGDRSFEDNGRGVHRASSDEETKREDSTMLDGGRGRDGKDHFSNSSGDRSFQVTIMFVRKLLLHSIVHVKLASFIQVKEELEALIKTHDVLQDEVLVMEERLEVKEVLCSELEKKSKRLEDLLSNEKKLTSQRRKELAKLHKSYSKVRECGDNLKGCEQELQSLVNSAAREGVAGADEGLENGYVQYKV
ncbi:glycine-rich RNA-binding protein RZ1B isoform X1 [Brassica napus]|uniref:glycine-rich RNA-binding protein RZ1B isoform X1 n=1 Tax=Brassica napus TaxID=3708 RepID=UPI0020797762|nr:glycine-rich RNA-binding protein RZ1B isoform X1 [Brassica napus]